MELAWHFVGGKLRDGRPIPEDGEWLEHAGEIVWCQNGLYASRAAMDALQYAPGATLCRVECEQIEREDKEKFVCRRRRIVARANAEEMLREYARWCALQVVHLWECPDVVKQYLETGDESLREAARAAASAAAREAAWAAASAAAREAAWAAASAAAREAAWAGDWAGDWEAARAAQFKHFEEMALSLVSGKGA